MNSFKIIKMDLINLKYLLWDIVILTLHGYGRTEKLNERLHEAGRHNLNILITYSRIMALNFVPPLRLIIGG